MNLVQAAVLGVTQGLSEFAPISSSGHLILVPWAFGWNDVLADADANKAFDVALHLGTFLGAALYLRREVWTLTRAWFASVRARAVRSAEERLAWFLALSAIPGAVAGALGEKFINERLGEPWQIAVFLLVFGVLLYAVDARAKQAVSYHDIGARQATAMAVGQALALMPGVSRSGVTITAGRATGMTRDAAARFSFLMSLPIILGAGVYSGVRALSSDVGGSFTAGAVAVGVTASAVTGALAVWGVLAFVRRYSMAAFLAYRVAVAAAVLLLIATNVRPATV